MLYNLQPRERTSQRGMKSLRRDFKNVAEKENNIGHSSQVVTFHVTNETFRLIWHVSKQFVAANSAVDV